MLAINTIKVVFLLASFLFLPNESQSGIQTPLEQGAYSTYTTNDKIVEFLTQCDDQSDLIHLDLINISEKQFPVVFISNEQQASSKMTLMLLAQLHGNEPSGMEGLLLLIKDFAVGRHLDLLDSLNLLILPQCNPWGADRHTRRNAQDIDLNRDQLLLMAEESRIIQHLFNDYRPHMTVDFHEYYPFGRSWIDFGYRRDFDIQLGGPTNLNIDDALISLFYQLALPDTKQQLEDQGFSFFEYTVGNFALGERLRRSTVDINDGRQSFGIAGTFSMIVEGMNGRDSLDRIERRAKSQHATALALLRVAYQHKSKIKNAVDQARIKLTTGSDPVSIRQDHFRGKILLNYPLLSLKTGNDTVFRVVEYHAQIGSLLEVGSPKGYLVPKNDAMLTAWLKRSEYDFYEEIPEGGQAFAYRIKSLKTRVDEELENYYPEVEKIPVSRLNPEDFYFVPAAGIYRHKLITALEPQAMYGLANYAEFEYLLRQGIFPVLRVE